MNELLIKEIVGMTGSILVAISMMCKTTTDRGVMWLRIFNLIGSLIFVVYGIMLPAYSTIILNCICVVLNAVGLINIIKKMRRNTGINKHNKKL